MVDWLGWHFLREDRCLNYPPHTLVEPGSVLSISESPILCKRGFHASKKALDALQYASDSPVLWVSQVCLKGAMEEDETKAVAQSREHLWIADCTRTLHEFALWCAESALNREREQGREPDERCWQALVMKRKWMDGLATIEELAAARDTAREAAWKAAQAAAREDARAAAWEDARAAAREAAWKAAQAAAREDARAAAWEAAWAAARGAAWEAAWAAAREAQNHQLEAMLFTLRKE